MTETGTEMEMEICHWTLWTLWSHDGGINQSWLPVRSFDRFPDTAETHIWVNAHLHFILTVQLIWLDYGSSYFNGTFNFVDKGPDSN